MSTTDSTKTPTSIKDKGARRGRLAPDPELWQALGGDKGLRRVIDEFYVRVFADDQLAPFFAGVRREFAADKQFSFLRSILTGERNYFGNHPRNAHFWMVISDDLFDYREDLMERCLLEHGLSKDLAGRVRSIDEIFRRAIVKDEPLRNERAAPAEGFEVARLEVGSLCDACEGEIPEGAMATYHVRTGKTHCSSCRPLDGAESFHP